MSQPVSPDFGANPSRFNDRWPGTIRVSRLHDGTYDERPGALALDRKGVPTAANLDVGRTRSRPHLKMHDRNVFVPNDRLHLHREETLVTRRGELIQPGGQIEGIGNRLSRSR